jgi:predicted Zn-dependent protease
MVGVALGMRPHLRAWYHRRIARMELERYHAPQAIGHLQICREIWPHDPEVLLLAARAARCIRVYGDSERLLGMYRQVRGHDQAHALEQLLLLAECQGEGATEQCWSRVEAGDADAPLYLEALTRGYLRQYRLGWARICLDRWRKLQPDNTQALYLEGLTLLDYLHDRAAAVDSLRRVLELDPDHEEARLGLAVALLMGKSFAEAAEHFQHLLRSQPDNLRLQVGLAECLDGLDQTAEAVRLVDDVLAQQPGFVTALSLRGQLALKSEQWAEAESWLREAIRRDPSDHRARYSLILCLERLGREEEANRQRKELKQMEEDLSRFNEIVTRDIAQRPTDPALHCTLGQLLLRGGQREEGIRWLQSALHLDPNYAPARQALAECLSQAKGQAQPSSP